MSKAQKAKARAKKRGQKRGRKPVPAKLALQRLERPPRMGSLGRPLQRTLIETLHALRALTHRQAWAAKRFRDGWEIVHNAGDGRSSNDYSDYGGGTTPMAGWQSTPEQLGRLVRMSGKGADYLTALHKMDDHDVSLLDRFGRPKEAGTRGVTRRIVIAVACEERSTGQLDKDAGKSHGWAMGVLKEGLRVYLDEFGHLFAKEVPPWLLR